ncbi:hypothetical protein ASPWEDRAFT_174030 [Aspergillus wentii DTO 134E9]|uniref:Uncharacterized protein n=1 Tax=Aspergillus wentii DTO 134E9 TaxID=1073089 RepID=A0A1L9RCE2_ASPWE|nr:uncharacterized protein ASPWEDRAFT_174030 [Aspergillus wentii DTO 134E9]OJJ32581.1 hypothetical protein ASPWEDRAFT_174030 [Aspergillus wentii DTO 134E9]
MSQMRLLSFIGALLWGVQLRLGASCILPTTHVTSAVASPESPSTASAIFQTGQFPSANPSRITNQQNKDSPAAHTLTKFVTTIIGGGQGSPTPTSTQTLSNSASSNSVPPLQPTHGPDQKLSASQSRTHLLTNLAGAGTTSAPSTTLSRSYHGQFDAKATLTTSSRLQDASKSAIADMVTQDSTNNTTRILEVQVLPSAGSDSDSHGSIFKPNSLMAQPGEIVKFYFHDSYLLRMTSLEDPCSIFPSSLNEPWGSESMVASYQLPVQSASPVWLHVNLNDPEYTCDNRTVFAINPGDHMNDFLAHAVSSN